MPATATRTRRYEVTSARHVHEDYRDPLTGVEARLEHFVNGLGEHVICYHSYAGEEVAPDVFRHTTYAEAVDRWRSLRAALVAVGYERTR